MKYSMLKKSAFAVMAMMFVSAAFAQEDTEIAVDTVETIVIAPEPVKVEPVKEEEGKPEKPAPGLPEKKGPTAQDAAKSITAQMKDQLSLVGDQNTKVFIVNLDFMKKTFENNKKGDKGERNKRQRGLEDERDAKLKSVLNDRQFKVFIASRGVDRKRIIPFYEL